MGNRYGGNLILSRFLSNTKHEVKIAAWNKSSYTLKKVDWLFDGIFYNLVKIRTAQDDIDVHGYKGYYVWNHNMPYFVQDLLDFGPDLVICDDDLYTAHFANSFNIPLWYCSPLLLVRGMEKDSFFYKEYCKLFANKHHSKYPFPPADKYLIYHPFGDIKFRPILREGFEWIKPYHLDIPEKEIIYDNLFLSHDLERNKILEKLCKSIPHSIFQNPEYIGQSKKILITGDTSHLSDAFYAGKIISVAPRTTEEKTRRTVKNWTDTEGLLNAILVKEYSIGENYGQIEFMENYATSELLKKFYYKEDYLSIQKTKYLHEMVEDFA